MLAGTIRRYSAEVVMLSKSTRPTLPSIVAGLLVVALTSANAFAGSGHHKAVVVAHPHRCSYTPPYEAYAPPCDYKPYYYSAWNPFSLYSVYDHLSGGLQLCHLPTEPCDNGHRVTN